MNRNKRGKESHHKANMWQNTATNCWKLHEQIIITIVKMVPLTLEGHCWKCVEGHGFTPDEEFSYGYSTLSHNIDSADISMTSRTSTLNNGHFYVWHTTSVSTPIVSEDIGARKPEIFTSSRKSQPPPEEITDNMHDPLHHLEKETKVNMSLEKPINR